MELRRAVFLDRDGVLNRPIVVEGKPFAPRSWEGFVLLDGVEAACRRIRAADYLLIGVTNQPDIANGTQDAAFVAAVNIWLCQKLGLDEFKLCPHDDRDGCTCRKPKPGMLLEAAAHWNIDLSESFMVGDRWRDCAAGKAAGCRTIHIDWSYREKQPDAPDHVCGSLGAAADWLLSTGNSSGNGNNSGNGGRLRLGQELPKS